MLRFIFLLLFPVVITAQSISDSTMERAYDNAIKGISWALENIPKKKQVANNDLIYDNKLIAKVKLAKGINGIRIESCGYFDTYEVEVRLYKSMDNLIKEGFIKKDSIAVSVKEVSPVRMRSKAGRKR
ncbi:MAG: hypothetical protein WCJ01_04660 [Ignavibacteria bacterium]